MRLYHFSSSSGIKEFVPRPPLRHPEAEPLVYAIDEERSPLYFFPRDCPRIGVWPEPASLDEDLAWFAREAGGPRMLLFIDFCWADEWSSGQLVRYEFAPGPPFQDCRDHGVWASREPAVPIDERVLHDLPKLAADSGARVVDCDLAAEGLRWLNPAQRPAVSLHVSMVRMSNLTHWRGGPGTPVAPPAS